MSDGLPYDSDAGRNVAAAITALMTGRAYRQSALIAAGATGPYDEYEKNREAHNGVMRMHRDASHDVDPTGIKGELLEAAQRSWDEAVELGERARLPQRAGDGAGADRDDQLPDGLRHDRDRARLLAGQVQGAGRRRADDDRQPVGAAGAAHARLRGAAGRADQRPHRRAEHDRRRPRAQGGAPAGLRRRGRRAGDHRTPATST